MSRQIGNILVEKGLITQEILAQALVAQKQTGNKLGQVLVDEGFISEDNLVDALAERLGISRITLDSVTIDPELTKLINSDLANRYQVVPILKLARTLTVAMVDPLDVVAVDELKYVTKMRINRSIATRANIAAAIEELYSVRDTLDEALEDVTRRRERDAVPAISGELRDEDLAGEAPVIKYVNLLIAQATKARASDIHIEPDEDSVRIRYRVGGLLRHEGSPPKAIQSALISRLKIMSDLDVSEKRIPQDGRFTFSWGTQTVDVRVSTLPTIHGEKVVMRLLDRRNLIIGVDKLGFAEQVLSDFRHIIHKPEGLILICGPTGSGKTSTLYAVLNEINSIEKNVITIEDPVEYNLRGINQVQTNDKAGLTFASCLRSILRQNPDIIMVGEIRDTETAEMAVRSSMTGHLVLSTIHTNDAASAVSRLIDMGIEPFLLASSLMGVLAQRLVRTICPSCKVEEKVAPAILEQFELDPGIEPTFYCGSGCDDCHHTGYRGQMGVFEFLAVSDAIKELILANSSSGRIAKVAVAEGMLSLHRDALDKVLDGRTTHKEVLRVSQRSEVSEKRELDAATV
jgi:type IV pilus assembly protein PilB